MVRTIPKLPSGVPGGLRQVFQKLDITLITPENAVERCLSFLHDECVSTLLRFQIIDKVETAAGDFIGQMTLEFIAAKDPVDFCRGILHEFHELQAMLAAAAYGGRASPVGRRLRHCGCHPDQTLSHICQPLSQQWRNLAESLC